MNAPCILHSLRVIVEPDRIVQLCAPGSAELVAAIKVEHGMLKGIVSKSWMLIQHPDKGLLGLPLCGDHQRSWQFQWEHENVKIEVCTDLGWTEVHDWALVERALTYK